MMMVVVGANAFKYPHLHHNTMPCAIMPILTRPTKAISCLEKKMYQLFFDQSSFQWNLYPGEKFTKGWASSFSIQISRQLLKASPVNIPFK